ncbi:hypothetical protein CAF53_12135 [Sphingobium sp. LB126]|nr:hypothetical protein CAF53_12135 [Sphingobium sp. LB126]
MGTTQRAELFARHHFSFAGYARSDRTNWGSLRILNHNFLAPGASTVPQPLDHFDILQWVLRGRVGHVGTLGTSHLAQARHIQLISSGEGLVHADINPDKEEAEFLELRFPAPEGHGPAFRAVGQFPGKEDGGRWTLLASGRRDDHALLLRAPSRVWGARIETGEQLHANLDPRASCYIVAGSGRSVLGDNYLLDPGDGLAIQGESEATIRAIETAEILLVESL